MSLAARHSILDFTESAYRRLIRTTRKRYTFEFFGTSQTAPHVLWRHDIDLSVHRALKLAEIESSLGVTSTYFFLLHSEFYNLLEPEIIRRARRIIELGHRIGLHFDPSVYPDCRTLAKLEPKITWEKKLLEEVLSAPVRVFSLHNPTPRSLVLFTPDMVVGMINAYGNGLKRKYLYCSDSNGYWRHKRLFDLIQDSDALSVHVLTHPEWWTRDPISPWERVQRCVYGRAAVTLDKYKRSLRRDGRANVGIRR